MTLSKRTLYAGGAFAGLTALIFAIGKLLKSASPMPANPPNGSSAVSSGMQIHPEASPQTQWIPDFSEFPDWWTQTENEAAATAVATATASEPTEVNPVFYLSYGLVISTGDIQASRSIWDIFGSDPALTEAAAPRYLLTRTIQVAMSDPRSGEYLRALSVNDPVVAGSGVLTWNRGAGIMQFDESKLSEGMVAIESDLRNLSPAASTIRVYVRGNASPILPTARLESAVAESITRSGIRNAVFGGRTEQALLTLR